MYLIDTRLMAVRNAGDMDTKSQHRHLANLQAHWQDNACSDAKYNLHRAVEERKRGNIVLSRGYMQEYKLDVEFGAWRGRVSKRERAKGL